jgi:3-dehydroquinate dehydratase II
MAAKTAKILVINGPNLNMLGKREPQIYGSEDLKSIETRCKKEAARLKLAVEFKQSNHEGELIDWIQKANEAYAGLIINAGGYTHTSVAIRDALLTLDIPIMEVHLSNLYKREAFRHHSYITYTAQGLICGLGGKGYELALSALAELI